MTVDGTRIADGICHQLRDEIERDGVAPHLTIVTCAPNRATQQYLARKTARAHEVGIPTALLEFPHEATTKELISSIRARTPHTDGVVVQLPLPKHIDTDAVLSAVPETHDVDVLNPTASERSVLPPVVAAIAHLTELYDISLLGAEVVVVGNGRLVGAPAAAWAESVGANVTVLTKNDADITRAVAGADVLILGAGQSGLITPGMLKEGVALFDAGASEVGGRVVGDADPRCAEVASLFTPVPGGIGPLTIAMLLKNLFILTG